MSVFVKFVVKKKVAVAQKKVCCPVIVVEVEAVVRVKVEVRKLLVPSLLVSKVRLLPMVDAHPWAQSRHPRLHAPLVLAVHGRQEDGQTCWPHPSVLLRHPSMEPSPHSRRLHVVAPKFPAPMSLSSRNHVSSTSRRHRADQDSGRQSWSPESFEVELDGDVDCNPIDAVSSKLHT